MALGYTKTINYGNAGNFVYDSNQVEFVSGVARLKNMQPNATFYAPFNTVADGLYGGGVLASTVSGATITAGSGGKFGEGLNCTGGGLKYAYWAATGNADFTQTGTVAFFVKPNYTGIPAGAYEFFSIGKDHAGGLNNMIECYHNNGDGHIWFRVFDQAAVNIFSADLGVWSPVSGTWYHFEFNIDITTGASRLFINGAQFGATQVATGTRSASTIGFLNLGTDRLLTGTTNFTFDELLVSNAVSHTGAFTVPSAEQIRYSKNNPSVLETNPIGVNGFLSFATVLSASGSDAVGFTFYSGGVEYYLNAGVVTAADGTFAKTNTSAQIIAGIAAINTFVAAGVTGFKWNAYLHSNDGSTTPTITSATYGYDFFVDTSANPNVCTLYMKAEDFSENAASDVILIIENKKGFFNGNAFVKPYLKTYTAKPTGYIEAQVIETATPATSYYFSYSYTDVNGLTQTKTLGKATVPNAVSAALSSLTFS